MYHNWSLKKSLAGILVSLIILSNSGYIPTVSAANESISCSGDSGSPTTLTESDYGGDDVTFTNGNGILGGTCYIDSNFSPKSITIQSGVTLVANGAVDIDINASDFVTIQSGGTLTHTESGRYGLQLTAATININSGGKIDVSAKGCRGGNEINQNGYGPSDTEDYNSTCATSSGGGGYGTGYNEAGGGSYGGTATWSFGPYGSTDTPFYLGSGGGGNTGAGLRGGNGGGKAYIVATNAIDVDGNILANGEDGLGSSGYTSGGGSGGSVYIQAGNYSGSGHIKAEGGDGYSWSTNSYAGAGGRVKIAYSTIELIVPTISVAAGTGGYEGATAGTSGTSLLVSAGFDTTESTVAEGAGTHEITIETSSNVSSDTTINYSVISLLAFDELDFELASGSATITNGTNSTTLEIPILEDDNYEGDETFIINLTSANNGVILNSSSSHTVTISDNDSAGLTIQESDGTTAVSEAGTTDTISVALTSQPVIPGQEVTVTLAGSDKLSLSTTELVFDDTNWDTAQSVTVSSTNDDIDQANTYDQQITFTTESLDAAYDDLEITPIDVTATDDDTSALVATESDDNTEVDEAESTEDTFTLSLQTEPVNDVTIALSLGADSSQLSLDETELTFTAENWDTPQTVTVTATDDDIDENITEIYSVSYTATSVDTNYDELEGEISVTVNDDDTADISRAVTGILGINVEETAETSDTVTFVLDSEPTADVEIAFTVDDAQFSVDTESLTFTAENWDTEQTVTITAIDDNIDETSSETYTADLAYAASSVDSNYDEISETLTVTITDNDTSNITISQTDDTTEVTEGGATDTITIVLDTEPTADVEIAVSVDEQATVDSETASFTNLNWDTPQTITISAVDDTTYETEQSATITFAATSEDENYNEFSLETIAVTITENDSAPAADTAEEPAATGGGGSSPKGTSQPQAATLAPKTTTPVAINEVKDPKSPNQIEFAAETELKSLNNSEEKIKVYTPVVYEAKDLNPDVKKELANLELGLKPKFGIDIRTSVSHVELSKEATVKIEVGEKFKEVGNLEVWYYNEKTKRLEFVTNKVNKTLDGKKVSFKTPHFSYFVIVENEKAPTRTLAKLDAPIWYKDAMYKTIIFGVTTEAESKTHSFQEEVTDSLTLQYFAKAIKKEVKVNMESKSKISRGDALKMLDLMTPDLKRNKVINANSYFSDINGDNDLRKALEKAIEHEIISTSANKFRPKDNLTYSELVSLASKLVQR
jgi:hypothetical protein